MAISAYGVLGVLLLRNTQYAIRSRLFAYKEVS
jgi:hypothetical protein